MSPELYLWTESLLSSRNLGAALAGAEDLDWLSSPATPGFVTPGTPEVPVLVLCAAWGKGGVDATAVALAAAG
jgi:hypothetical protein